MIVFGLKFAAVEIFLSSLSFRTFFSLNSLTLIFLLPSFPYLVRFKSEFPYYYGECPSCKEKEKEEKNEIKTENENENKSENGSDKKIKDVKGSQLLGHVRSSKEDQKYLAGNICIFGLDVLQRECVCVYVCVSERERCWGILI